jgi:hypothetical protein
MSAAMIECILYCGILRMEGEKVERRDLKKEGGRRGRASI